MAWILIDMIHLNEYTICNMLKRSAMFEYITVPGAKKTAGDRLKTDKNQTGGKWLEEYIDY